MRNKRNLTYRVAAVFDTETTNINLGDEEHEEWRAFPVTYQVNDLRKLASVAEYVPGVSDNIKIYRTASDFVGFIADLIEYHAYTSAVPVVCGYNLMFDAQTVLNLLSERYTMGVSAQSSTNVYTLDLYDKSDVFRMDAPLLRFWDTFHLEMGGLAAMGQTAGLAKLKGDWDYSLVRTPDTDITSDEYGYAARDVQVIPAYLRYLLESNAWMTPDMLGHTVLTKTSVVRRMAEHEIGPLRTSNNSTIKKNFMAMCRAEMPRDYTSYALRKACFIGGLTFTAAAFASTVQTNALSLDATSMHHLLINGRMVPVNFKRTRDRKMLKAYCDQVIKTSREYVLAHYAKPFDCAFHMRVAFNNLRLKRGSAFERYGIAIIPQGKFGFSAMTRAEYAKSEASRESEEATRMYGWRNMGYGVEFAFSKLYAAERAVVHVSELELWAISRVYEWDSIEPICGEVTMRFEFPPDYVVLQSHQLFERKSDMKHIDNTYKEGVAYPENIPESIPAGIARGLRDGTLTQGFVKSYYQSSTKGAFNSIYGTQAQDVFKAEYRIAGGVISVNPQTVLTPDNFAERMPKHPKVLYTYGLRIAGGSRVHLILAIELMHDALGERCRITGGDTDSVKASVDADVTDAEVEAAIEPLLIAATSAINAASMRVRNEYPAMASSLKHVGGFEVENAGEGTRWAYHMDVWNKARISCDTDGNTHITCAGLSRPEHTYNMEVLVHDLLQNASPYDVLPQVFGYNVFVSSEVSHSLQRTRPDVSDMFDADVTDYTGKTTRVVAPEAIALYPCGRMLGDTTAMSNALNVKYIRKHYNRDVDTRERIVGARDVYVDENGKAHGTPYVFIE